MRGGPTAGPLWVLPVEYTPSGPGGTESGTPSDFTPASVANPFPVVPIPGGGATVITGSDGDITMTAVTSVAIRAATPNTKSLTIQNTGATNNVTVAYVTPATATNGRCVLGPLQSVTFSGAAACLAYYGYSTAGTTVCWEAEA